MSDHFCEKNKFIIATTLIQNFFVILIWQIYERVFHLFGGGTGTECDSWGILSIDHRMAGYCPYTSTKHIVIRLPYFAICIHIQHPVANDWIVIYTTRFVYNLLCPISVYLMHHTRSLLDKCWSLPISSSLSIPCGDSHNTLLYRMHAWPATPYRSVPSSGRCGGDDL